MSSSNCVINDNDLYNRNIVNLDRNSIFKQELIEVLKKGFNQILSRLDSISGKLLFLENTISNKLSLKD